MHSQGKFRGEIHNNTISTDNPPVKFQRGTNMLNNNNNNMVECLLNNNNTVKNNTVKYRNKITATVNSK